MGPLQALDTQEEIYTVVRSTASIGPGLDSPSMDLPGDTIGFTTGSRVWR